MKIKATYHVHKAELTQCEPWGDSDNPMTLFRFEGVSGGDGHPGNEVTIVMDRFAIARMQEQVAACRLLGSTERYDKLRSAVGDLPPDALRRRFDGTYFSS